MRTCLGVLHVLLCIYSKIHHVIYSTGWYLALDESNRMKSAYFTSHPSKFPPPQMVNGWNPFCFFKAPVSHPPFSQFNWTFRKATGRHYTKYWFSPDIGSLHTRSTGRSLHCQVEQPRERQKKSIFSKLHHKNGSKFYQFFFMSRYTQYLLHTKNS